MIPRGLTKEGPQIDPTQFPQRYGFPTKLYEESESVLHHKNMCIAHNEGLVRVVSYLAGAKREKFFIDGIIPDRLLKETFL